MIKNCRKCVNYKTESCIGKESRKIIKEDYNTDCWMSEADKELCDLLCGSVEEDE